MTQTQAPATLQRLTGNLNAVIRGKSRAIELLVASLLAGGHVLIEDMPGLGKTTLAKALARSIDADFSRVQFTPDLLPTDILGGSVYNPQSGAFVFHHGPVFTNVLLADEINRASPRTQSSLLEAMAEGQATIEGRHNPLPELFMVIATQNPIEFHGTYPLPEAQLDRFLVRMALGYADTATERQILFEQQTAHPLESIGPVLSLGDVLELRAGTRRVHVDEELGGYIVDLVHATRTHPQVHMGASPRGALGLFRLAQAQAVLAGRDFVMPEDIQSAAAPVLAHRVLLDNKARYSGVAKQAIIEEVVASVEVPT